MAPNSPSSYELFGPYLPTWETLEYEWNASHVPPEERERYVSLLRTCTVVTTTLTLTGLVRDAVPEGNAIRLSLALLTGVQRGVYDYVKTKNEDRRPSLICTGHPQSHAPLHLILVPRDARIPTSLKYSGLSKCRANLGEGKTALEAYAAYKHHPDLFARFPVFTTQKNAEGKPCIVRAVGYAQDIVLEHKDDVVLTFAVCAAQPLKSLSVSPVHGKTVTTPTDTRVHGEHVNEAVFLLFVMHDAVDRPAPSWAYPLPGPEPSERIVNVEN